MRINTVVSRFLAVLLITATLVTGCAPAAQPTAAPAPAKPAAAPAAPAAAPAAPAAAPAAPAAAPAAPAAPAATTAPAAPAAAAPAAGGAPVTLNLWGGFPEIQPVFEKAAAEYKKTHPNVTINVLTAPLREFEQKMAATIPADSAADILDANPFAIQKYVAAGLLPPVPDKLVTWMTQPGRIPKNLLENNKGKDGKYYGVNYFMGRHGVYYNTDMFKAAGLPNGPQTMDDLNTMSQKLAKTDASGTLTVSGISLRLSGAGSGIAEKFWMWLFPMGGSIIEQGKSGKWHNNYNNEAGWATMQMYLDSVYKTKVVNHQIKADTEAFELGLTAMYARESSVIGDIAKKAPTLNYSAMPMPKGKRWGDLANGENLYVTKSSKNPEVAWDFVSFLVSDQWMMELVNVTGWLPQRADLDFKALIEKYPAYKAFLYSDPNYELYVYPMLPEFDEIETKMAEKLAKMYLDPTLATNQDAMKKAMADMAKETDDILKRNGNYGE
jgi:multiple sugar transport system substrate-binding protein